MKRLLSYCFSTRVRRWTSTIVAIIFLGICTHGMVFYIDEVCAVPTLGLLSILGWMFITIGFLWFILMALSPELILPSILEDWFKDPWKTSTPPVSDLTQSDDSEEVKFDDFNPRQLRVNPQSRFRSLYILLISLTLLGTHWAYEGFLTRYQRLGTVMIYLRNDDSLTRLRGLNLLIEQGKHLMTQSHLPEKLELLLSRSLMDPDEGVQARSAFVAGAFDLTFVIPQLEKMAAENEILREVALLALAEIKVDVLQENKIHQSLERLLKLPHVIKSAPYAMAIALGQQRLISAHPVLKKLYQEMSPPQKSTPSETKQSDEDANNRTKSVKIREVVVWALGESRDPTSLPFLSQSLFDPALSVRCLSAYSLEKMVVFESSPVLQRAFERSKKEEECPLITLPTQEGVQAQTMMPQWNYQLTLVRALATTDDPHLLKWLVDHQRGIDKKAHLLMAKYYKILEKKDQKGLLDDFKRRNLKK